MKSTLYIRIMSINSGQSGVFSVTIDQPRIPACIVNADICNDKKLWDNTSELIYSCSKESLPCVIVKENISSGSHPQITTHSSDTVSVSFSPELLEASHCSPFKAQPNSEENINDLLIDINHLRREHLRESLLGDGFFPKLVVNQYIFNNPPVTSNRVEKNNTQITAENKYENITQDQVTFQDNKNKEIEAILPSEEALDKNLDRIEKFSPEVEPDNHEVEVTANTPILSDEELSEISSDLRKIEKQLDDVNLASWGRSNDFDGGVYSPDSLSILAVGQKSPPLKAKPKPEDYDYNDESEAAISRSKILSFLQRMGKTNAEDVYETSSIQQNDEPEETREKIELKPKKKLLLNFNPFKKSSVKAMPAQSDSETFVSCDSLTGECKNEVEDKTVQTSFITSVNDTIIQEMPILFLFNQAGYPLTDTIGRFLKNHHDVQMLQVETLEQIKKMQVFDSHGFHPDNPHFDPTKKPIPVTNHEIKIIDKSSNPQRLYNSMGYPLSDEDGNVLRDSQGHFLVILDSVGIPMCCAKGGPIYLSDGKLWVTEKNAYDILHSGRPDVVEKPFEQIQIGRRDDLDKSLLGLKPSENDSINNKIYQILPEKRTSYNMLSSLLLRDEQKGTPASGFLQAMSSIPTITKLKYNGTTKDKPKIPFKARRDNADYFNDMNEIGRLARETLNFSEPFSLNYPSSGNISVDFDYNSENNFVVGYESEPPSCDYLLNDTNE